LLQSYSLIINLDNSLKTEIGIVTALIFPILNVLISNIYLTDYLTNDILIVGCH